MGYKGKIVFIVGLLSQPRCIKRVKAFLDDGFECDVFGYDRGKYDINSYPSRVNVVKLGEIEDGGAYFSKLRRMFCDIKKCVREYEEEKVAFYAFGFIPAVMLRVMKQKYIYEISDILYAYPRFKYVLNVLKFIDKRLIKKSMATIMTSGGFYNFYSLKTSNIFVVPNRVSPSLNRGAITVQKANKEHLSFGFVGAIRYKSIFDFAETIGQFFPQHSFHFYGATLMPENERKLKILQQKYNNIFSHGPFKNPIDLPDIYKTIDIVVSCYTVSSLNEQLAEPNKLYEAIFFCKPIVVSSNIFLSERVEELKCGFCIDASSEALIKEFVENIEPQKIDEISEHELRLSQDIFINNQKDLNNYIAASLL